MDLNQRQRELNAEIASVDEQILQLQTLKRSLASEIKAVTAELEELDRRRVSATTTADLHGLSRASNGNLRYAFT